MTHRYRGTGFGALGGIDEPCRVRYLNPPFAYDPIGYSRCLVDQARDAECSATAAAATTGMVRQREEMMRTWASAGFYRPADLEKIIGQTYDVIAKATSVAQSALSERTTEKTAISQALSEALAQKGKSLPFVQALNQARATGVQVIDAPGLKRWVSAALIAAEGCYEAVALVHCHRPWFLSGLEHAAVAIDALWKVVRVIGQITVAAGQAILKVPDTLSTLWTIATYGTLAGVAIWAAIKMRKK